MFNAVARTRCFSQGGEVAAQNHPFFLQPTSMVSVPFRRHLSTLLYILLNHFQDPFENKFDWMPSKKQ